MKLNSKALLSNHWEIGLEGGQRNLGWKAAKTRDLVESTWAREWGSPQSGQMGQEEHAMRASSWERKWNGQSWYPLPDRMDAVLILPKSSLLKFGRLPSPQDLYRQLLWMNACVTTSTNSAFWNPNPKWAFGQRGGTLMKRTKTPQEEPVSLWALSAACHMCEELVRVTCAAGRVSSCHPSRP